MRLRSIKWNGRRITKPGIYAEIPLDLYHHHEICDGPSVSGSQLADINPDLGSPAYFFAFWSGNPECAERKESRSMAIGRAVHHLFLGQKFFSKYFAVQPDEWPEPDGKMKPWNNNRNVCKKWNQARERDGQTVLLAKEVPLIKRMAISVQRHPFAKEFLSGLIEQSIFWKDKETGIWCKWRPDTIPTVSLDVADLKTIRSVMWPAIAGAIREFAYYQRAALGRWAFREVLGAELGSYTLFFVERDAPWQCRDVRLEDQDLDRGERMNRATLRTFARCIQSGKWPGPGYGAEGSERAGMSAAAREHIDNALRYEGLADGKD